MSDFLSEFRAKFDAMCDNELEVLFHLEMMPPKKVNGIWRIPTIEEARAELAQMQEGK